MKIQNNFKNNKINNQYLKIILIKFKIENINQNNNYKFNFNYQKIYKIKINNKNIVNIISNNMIKFNTIKMIMNEMKTY